MTLSTTAKKLFSFKNLNLKTESAFIHDMRELAEETNAQNEDELLKIAAETYEFETEAELKCARQLIEWNVDFDTFEEDFGYTIKEYIKRGEGYFSAKNLGDLTYEDLLAACREYIDGLEEDLEEEYGEDHDMDVLEEDLDFDNVVILAKTKAIYQKHTAANGWIDMQSVCRDIDADPILELR
tara:strand:- start:7 stop:555 length:549 start_codon:yes stop_codon:yes gene_type:complete